MNTVLPSINLKWYKGDLYSDGPIEDVITNIIKSSEPEDYIDGIYNNTSWPAIYHLSENRKNILKWYDFKPQSEVLEIGCGMGAITPMLCDKAKSVTAVEISKRRAEAVQYRCRNKRNLEIIVGNLNDIEFTKTYDYITLIGVLEYQGAFTEGPNPFVDFLKKIRSLLSPGGKLLVAIENKYGIKYWCGSREDHSGVPFDSLNNYKLSNSLARTFSKYELRRILKEGGFEHAKFYYSVPDYKFPEIIFTDENIPSKDSLLRSIQYHLRTDTLVADANELYPDLIDNKVIDFFANSFLVECSADSTDFNDLVSAFFPNARKDTYNVFTTIHSNGKVYKNACSKASRQHLRRTHHNLLKLAEAGIKTVTSQYKNGRQVSEYIDLPVFENHLIEAAMRKDAQAIIDGFKLLYDNILASSEHVKDTSAGVAGELKKMCSDLDVGVILKTGWIDMVQRNCFYDGEALIFFDQEYVCENVPAKHIVVRAIRYFYDYASVVKETCPLEVLLQELSLTDFNKFSQYCEEYFFGEIMEPRERFSALKNSFPYKTVEKNVNFLRKSDIYLYSASLKNDIDSIIASGDFASLSDFFERNDLHEVMDEDIGYLQIILGIYEYEQSNKTAFSFGDCKNLKSMIIKYLKVLNLLRLLSDMKSEIKIYNYFINQITELNFSKYALCVIIEREFRSREKIDLLKLVTYGTL